MPKKSPTKVVAIERVEEFFAAIRALADAGDETVERLKKDGASEVRSSNYAAGLVPGYECVRRFVEGVTGAGGLAKYEAQLAPMEARIAELSEIKRRGDKLADAAIKIVRK